MVRMSLMKIKYKKDEERRIGMMSDLIDEYNMFSQEVEDHKKVCTNEEEIEYNNDLYRVYMKYFMGNF